MFFDFSSAFYTTQPALLSSKLLDMQMEASLVAWIYNDLTGCPLYVRQHTLRHQWAAQGLHKWWCCLPSSSRSRCEQGLVVDFREQRTCPDPVINGKAVDIVDKLSFNTETVKFERVEESVSKRHFYIIYLHVHRFTCWLIISECQVWYELHNEAEWLNEAEQNWGRDTWVLINVNTDNGSFTAVEVARVKSTLKQGKSAGPDEIPPEVLKNWHLGDIIRRVSLQRCTTKWYWTGVPLTLMKRQPSFQEGRTSVAQLVALRRIIEEVRKNHLTAVLCLIYFKKAHNLMNRGVMMKILEAYDVPPNLLRATGTMYSGTRTKVVTQTATSRSWTS